MKLIFLEPGPSQRLHSLYRELVDFPPHGYQYLVPSHAMLSNARMIDFFEQMALRRMKHVRPLRDMVDYFTSFASLLYSKFVRNKTTEKIVLTYSSQHLIFDKKPWIVDLEFATALVSYGRFGLTKPIVEKLLTSNYCKKIIPWTNAGKETMLKGLNCKSFEDKIEVVHLAVRPKNFLKKYNNDKIKILFVGTGNPWNINESFRLKGGKEVIMAFKYLNKKYKNLELIIRSHVPDNVLAMQNKNIKIINKIVNWKTISKIFQEADIFLFPTHSTPGMVILDAMSYELPVITTDLWANSEMIKDGETGYLVKKSEKVPYVMSDFTPNWGSPFFTKFISKPDPEVIRQIIDKTSILIEDESLRRKMGYRSRREIEIGEFSIKRRNEKLKRIFDEGIS